MEEQFKQTQQEIEEMMKKIQEEATKSLMDDDKDKNGFIEDTDTDAEETSFETKRAQKEETLKTSVEKILDEYYSDLPDSRRDDIIDYVIRHATTGTALDIESILAGLLGSEYSE